MTTTGQAYQFIAKKLVAQEARNAILANAEKYWMVDPVYARSAAASVMVSEALDAIYRETTPRAVIGWPCAYCGGVRDNATFRCSGCGAPRTYTPKQICHPDLDYDDADQP